jgi:hypothetical protein
MKIIITERQSLKLIEQINGLNVAQGVPQAMSNSPLHIYCALRFLSQSKDTLTEKELKSDTLLNLSSIICEKAIRMGNCNPDRWEGVDAKSKPNRNTLSYSDFSTSYSKSSNYKSGAVSYNQPTFIKELMLTLGMSSIKKSGNGWVITDTYNFDNIMEKKPYLKTDNFFKMGLNTIRGIGGAIGGWITGKGVTSGIEEMMSQLHNTGYKGFPVQINVPFNGCKCKN